MSTAESATGKRLLEFFRSELAGAADISLSGLSADTHGLSRDHFIFDLHWTESGSPHRRELILIRDGDRPGQTDRTSEFRLLRALEGTGIPVPKAFWCDATAGLLERPFIVMERVSGVVTPSLSEAYPDQAGSRRTLAAQLAEILVALHGLDWQAIGLDFLRVPGYAPEDHASQRVGELEGLALFLNPPAVLNRALEWSRARVPRTERLVVCHGDYKMDNVMHADGRVVAILDWERARIGDPVEELAYATLPYLVSTGAAVGTLEPEEFVRRYAEGIGFAIDPEALFFWQVVHHALYAFYFMLLIEGARRRGVEALQDEEATQRPRIGQLLDLIEAQLGAPGAA
jgi:aminoglycoside phosphotransferase (APT) family kinase protein